VLRAHDGGQAYFDPANDPAANLWYWWDVKAMLARSGLPKDLKPFPFVVQLLPGTTTAEFPRPEEPKANLANNHLGYAITWFGLALTLLAVSAFYILDLRKRRRG
jgi:surfeit locus 1 family protein